MPKSLQREVGVGFLAALIFLIAIALVLINPKFADPNEPSGFQLTADFGRIDGLGVGSPVRMAGLNVGIVDRLSLTQSKRARVHMVLFDRSLPIPSDTAAVIETDGIFGEKYVELHPGGEFETLSSGQQVSYTQDSVILENLLNQIVARARGRTTAETGATD